jgi:hypothetical protein
MASPPGFGSRQTDYPGFTPCFSIQVLLKCKGSGSYFPYEIKGKLIFVAKKNRNFSVMYDEKIVGPEFDEISMPYCCAMVPLIRRNEWYWFVGSREGIKYLVSIQ